MIKRHRSSHLVLGKIFNFASLCPHLQAEVVAVRTRKERQQADAWRGNYNEQRYKLKRVTNSFPKYCQCSRLLSKTNSEVAMKTGVVERKQCFKNTQRSYIPLEISLLLICLGKKCKKEKGPGGASLELPPWAGSAIHYARYFYQKIEIVKAFYQACVCSHWKFCVHVWSFIFKEV